MQPKKTKTKKESSFTLLELLIVIAIIAILAAVVLIALDNAKQSANEARGLQFSQNIKSTLATDLVGEWTFDDQTNPGRDDSGNNNNGTLVNMEQEDWTDKGRIRGALNFDGVNEYVSVLSSASLNTITSGHQFTFESWIYPLVNDSRDIVGPWGNNPQWGYTFKLRTGNRLELRFQDTNGEWHAPSSNLNVIINQWNHVAVSYDAFKGELSFYINGRSDPISYNKVTNNNNSIFRIGYVGWVPFQGKIDEVRIYKRALTAYEIKALYAQGKMRHLADR